MNVRGYQTEGMRRLCFAPPECTFQRTEALIELLKFIIGAEQIANRMG